MESENRLWLMVGPFFLVNIVLDFQISSMECKEHQAKLNSMNQGADQQKKPGVTGASLDNLSTVPMLEESREKWGRGEDE